MNTRLLAATLCATALALPGAALAGPVSAATSTVSAFATELTPDPAALVQNAVALGVEFVPTGMSSGTRLESVRYRPRERARSYSRGPMMASPVQLHVGFFDPEGDGGNAFVAGFRAGPQVDPHVQIGIAGDWMHRSENATAILSEEPGPGGTTITTQQELSKSSIDLVPIMAFAQLSADQDLPVIPYFGVSGGYQILFLSATDFDTGAEFNGTFGGWAWQVWGGLALPLSGQSRLTGEVFVNNGEAHRDVDGPPGITYRETVGLDGTGMRVGLQWGF